MLVCCFEDISFLISILYKDDIISIFIETACFEYNYVEDDKHIEAKRVRDKKLTRQIK